MLRSCSTPCLPAKKFTEASHTKVFEIVGDVATASQVRGLVREALAGINAGVLPEVATGGLGGAYYFKNRFQAPIAIVKPQDEEPFAPNNPNGYVGKALGLPGVKRSILVGDACIREVAAFLLDHQCFARVPRTALVKAAHPVFNSNDSSLDLQTKLCSFQQYVEHDYDASEFGTAQFPVAAVHRIGILDVRLYNTDRHAGNILVRCLGKDVESGRRQLSGLREDYSVELTPIDHGYCLPETLDSAYFEWLHWPQASLPFSQEELDYIASLDVRAEVDMLQREVPMLGRGCLRILVLSTTFLQRAAAAGFTLYEIGSFMSRELRGLDEEASELEKLCHAALASLDDVSEATLDIDTGSSRASSLIGQSLLEIEDEDEEEDDDENHRIQFDMDHEEDSTESLPFGVFDDDSMDISTSAGSAVSGLTSLSIVKAPFIQSAQPGTAAGDGMDLELNATDLSGSKAPSTYETPFPPTSPSVNVPKVGGLRIGLGGREHGSTKLQPPASHASSMTAPRSIVGNHWNSKRVPSPRVGTMTSGYPSQASLVGGVDFSDMSDEEWSLFMDIFVGYLEEALETKRHERKSMSKRFGTSCKF